MTVAAASPPRCRWSRLRLGTCGRSGAGGATAPVGHRHRVRGGLADRVVHRSSARTSRPPTRARRSAFNFARQLGAGQQITPGRAGRRVRRGQPADHEEVVDAGDADGDAARLRPQPLEIAVPKGNPAGSPAWPTSPTPDLKVALCAEQVPCGAAAQKALDAAGVTLTPDTLEQDVKAALTKVRLGEVDAALVYRTDVLAAGDEVEGIEFPEAGRGRQRLPDRRADRARRTPTAPGVRRLRAVRRGPGGARRRRLRRP